MMVIFFDSVKTLWVKVSLERPNVLNVSGKISRLERCCPLEAKCRIGKSGWNEVCVLGGHTEKHNAQWECELPVI